MLTSLLLTAISVSGCNTCQKQTFVRRQVIIRQQPQVFYFVGQNLRLQASPDYQEFLRWRSLRAQPNSSAQRSPQSIVVRLCSQCHSGESPKGDFDITGPLPPEDVTRAMRMVVTGKMPPKKNLSGEQRGILIAELLNLEAAPQEVPQPPEPIE